jgi:hypothetical protein
MMNKCNVAGMASDFAFSKIRREERRQNDRKTPKISTSNVDRLVAAPVERLHFARLEVLL